MKISVLIPAYNCAATLNATIDSVLDQTAPADEILVMDDGSTDGKTRAIAESYGPRVKVYGQPNGGLARARNALIARASGELIAFLDSDDIWHPRYLEIQRSRFEEFPQAVAFFMGHVNFPDGQEIRWGADPLSMSFKTELISPLEFFKRYNRATGAFGCFSYCAVPMEILKALGPEPFKEQGAEDSYCCSLLSLKGPVVYCSASLTAYRIRPNSLSANHVWTFGVWVHTFELLEGQFKKTAGKEMLRAFGAAYAAKRRSYAKLLMGAGKTSEARSQLRLAFRNSLLPSSQAKSAAMLASTFLPRRLQPHWPSGLR